jgi:energy-coupling factor transporter ATP-binding protein EcfA2
MAEPTSVVVGGIKLANLLLEQAEKQGLIDRLTIAFKKKPRVLLLGATGTGKSNFLESLSVERPEPIARANRTVFPEAHLLTVEGTRPYRFVDTPGDTSPAMKDARIDAIRESLGARGGISGIINVVSYGYHEYQVTKDKVFLANGVVDPAFLTKHREIEIQQLDEWTSLLGSPITTSWLITVVTKADLWWDQRSVVNQHYSTGAYYAALREAQSLRPKVVMHSSVFSKFYGEAPLSGFFDEKDRQELKLQLVKALLAALLQHEV